MWDAAEYLRFADLRGRPFADLLDRVAAEDPRAVVDLGCGPGNQTVTLARRWPGASVEGIDSSPEMIDHANREHAGTPTKFTLADLRDWSPPEPVDVLVSNATFQWVPGHLDLLGRLAGAVRPGGWLAFQVPANFDEPSHTELAAVQRSPRWRERLAGLDLPRPAVATPPEYLERLAGLGAEVDVWQTTYFMVLPGEDAVLRWISGTGLRPVLTALDGAEREEFTAEYAARLRAAYPRRPFGTVLPYRRTFLTARIPA